jgi:hypothetical protein
MQCGPSGEFRFDSGEWSGSGRQYAADAVLHRSERHEVMISLLIEGRYAFKGGSTMKPVYGSAAAFALLATTSLAVSAPTAPAKSTDSLGLTSAQEHTIYRDIGREVKAQTAPNKFRAAVGSAVPSQIQVYSIPSNVAKQVEAVKDLDYALLKRRYDFFLWQKQVVLVDPSSKKIVDVING